MKAILHIKPSYIRMSKYVRRLLEEYENSYTDSYSSSIDDDRKKDYKDTGDINYIVSDIVLFLKENKINKETKYIFVPSMMTKISHIKSLQTLFDLDIIRYDYTTKLYINYDMNVIRLNPNQRKEYSNNKDTEDYKQLQKIVNVCGEYDGDLKKYSPKLHTLYEEIKDKETPLIVCGKDWESGLGWFYEYCREKGMKVEKVDLDFTVVVYINPDPDLMMYDIVDVYFFDILEYSKYMELMDIIYKNDMYDDKDITITIHFLIGDNSKIDSMYYNYIQQSMVENLNAIQDM